MMNQDFRAPHAADLDPTPGQTVAAHLLRTDHARSAGGAASLRQPWTPSPTR
jgi:hypothetical protein